jgi:hypothetical protein
MLYNFWYDNKLSLATKLMISLKIKCKSTTDYVYESIEDYNQGKPYKESFDYKLEILYGAGKGAA